MHCKWDEEVFNTNDIDDVYSAFMQITNECINRHIPTKVVTIRPKDKVFMTNTIRRLMRKRNRTHRKAVRTNNPLHWSNYRSLRNQVIDEIRRSRENYNKKTHRRNG